MASYQLHLTIKQMNHRQFPLHRLVQPDAYKKQKVLLSNISDCVFNQIKADQLSTALLTALCLPVFWYLQCALCVCGAPDKVPFADIHMRSIVPSSDI